MNAEIQVLERYGETIVHRGIEATIFPILTARVIDIVAGWGPARQVTWEYLADRKIPIEALMRVEAKRVRGFRRYTSAQYTKARVISRKVASGRRASRSERAVARVRLENRRLYAVPQD